MPPRHRKVDKNQVDVVERLREAGYGVFSIAIVGRKYPDLVVGKNNLNILVELKSDGGKLNDGQSDFFESWPGHVIVAYSSEEIIEAFERYVVYIKGKESA